MDAIPNKLLFNIEIPSAPIQKIVEIYSDLVAKNNNKWCKVDNYLKHNEIKASYQRGIFTPTWR